MGNKNFQKIIEDLKSKGIILFSSGNQLGVKNSTEIELSDNILELVKSNREELLAHLNKQKEANSITKTAGDYGLPPTVSNKRLGEFLELPVNKNNVFDIYPLTPLQKGFLFQDLYANDRSTYLCQFHCDLIGDFSLKSFKESWRHLIQQHTVLRTSVFAEELGIPVQCVYKNVVLPIKEIDHSALSDKAFEITFDTFLSTDREEGFFLDKAPLFRMALINRGNNNMRFVFTYHHILFDGWSIYNLMKNFQAIYDQLQKSEKSPQIVVDNFRTHVDNISKINEYEGLSYWKTYLSNLRSPSYFPLVKDTSLRSKLFGNGEIEFTIKGDFNSYAKKHRITENTLFQGAWLYLLSKYTGNESVVFGTTVTGRNSHEAGIESKVGLYISTIPVCGTLKPEFKVSEWLQQIQKDQTVAREEYAHLALGDIENQTSIKGGLFDTIVSFQNFPKETFEQFDGGTLSVGNIVGLDSTNYTISLVVNSFDGELNIIIKYNDQLVSRDVALKIKGHLETLIHSFLDDTQKILDLRYLTEEENKLLNTFNDTILEYPNNTIIDLFTEQVALHPDRMAAVYEDKKISYKELDERSNQVAQYLISEGIIPGTIVGLLLDRSIEMIIAIMGVLKTGAGYLPIDPNLPEKRIAYMLNHSRANFLLSLGEYLDQYSAYLPMKEIDSDEIISQTSEPVSVKTLANDLAYCIFTSGSTGEPKGVMMSHKSVVNLVKGLDERVYNTYGKDYLRVALLASFSFDASVQQIFGTLLQGHCLYLIDDENRKDGIGLLDFYNNNEIDLSDGTPTHLGMLVDASHEEHSIESLSSWILAGEALSKGLVNKFYNTFGETTQLYNFYGPTETCVDSTCYKVNRKELDKYDTVPIGKPLPNERVYVTDNYGGLVPIGVIGELCIGGYGLARSYIGKEALTSEKFSSDWIDGEDRVYRTGDMVRWLPDGNLEYHGRQDNQVKIRGYRIELSEVEHRLLNFPEIEKGIVVLSENEKEKFLIAYYQSKEAILVLKLREFLATLLPEYMIPSYFVHMEDFPLTITGKIDRKSLSKLELKKEEDYMEPFTEIEKRLAKIYSEVLDLDISLIGVNSNFFDLGGHSLKSVFLANKINKEFDLKISLKNITTSPTISGLSELIVSTTGTKHHVGIQPAEKMDFYPLSASQKQMFFLHEYNKDSKAYNIPIVVTLRGDLKKERFEGAFRDLIKRHSILRTSFEFVKDTPMQRISNTVAFSIVNISKEGTLENTINSFIKPFDLSNAPIWRVGILELSDKEHLMIIDTHHIISDQVTNEILIKDFIALYKGETLVKPTIQYVDYVMWRLEEDQQVQINQHKDYWLEKFSEEVPRLELPFDYLRPEKSSEKGGQYEITLDVSKVYKLKEIARTEGVTMYSLILAIYNVFLSKLSSQKDIVVGTPVVGREHADLQNVTGNFINTLPIRNLLDTKQTFKDFLQQVQEGISLALENQLFPHEELVALLNTENNFNENGLFNAFLDYRFENGRVDLQDTTLEIVESGIATVLSKFDLLLSVLDTENDLQLSFIYSKDLFKESSMERFSQYINSIIDEVVQDNTKSLRDMNMILEKEQVKLLIDFNNTQADYQKNKSVIDLFRDQVRLNPHTDALIFEEERLTYQELDIKTTDWGHSLVDLGITPGAVVGIRMTRSIDMIAAILGILKAGASYLILDPTLPNSRIAFMAKESNCSLIVTNIEEPFNVHKLCVWAPISVLDNHIGKKKNQKLPKIDINSLAYIMYTSGSTGEPKGCMISHANIYNYISSCNEYYFENSDMGNWALMSSMYFDLSVTAIFTSLTRGKKLFLCDEQKSIDQLLLESFTNPEVDTLKLTPTHLTLLEDLTIGQTNVRTIICGGEALKNSHIQIVKNLDKNIKVYNEYGPTEATVACVATEVSLDDKITIGYPMANTRICILDTDEKLVPIGVPGEVYIGGAGVCGGYINKPELTAKKFIRINEELFYKSGDMGKWTTDGKIEYLGRIDKQIKIRGYRIEPGEIESVLESNPSIEQAFVTAKGIDQEKQLCAYIKGDSEVQSEKLKETLSETLPYYMIPSNFVWLDAFPYTKNGKIDEKALMSLHTDQKTTYVAPSTQVEKDLVGLWAKILKKEESQIGVESNFTDLGGHSLNVIQLANSINKDYAIQIKLDDIFKGKTIRELSEMIAMQQWLEEGSNGKEKREEILL